MTGNIKSKGTLTGRVNSSGGNLTGSMNKLLELRGYSAYEVAVLNGFNGTEKEWLATFGKNGKSAYEVAIEGGFKGTVEEWLASLRGKDGVGIVKIEWTKNTMDGGSNIVTVYLSNGENLQFYVRNGTKGSPGTNGKSAYDIAVDYGFKGTEQEWLESLHGKDAESLTVEQIANIVAAYLDENPISSTSSWYSLAVWSATDPSEWAAPTLSERHPIYGLYVNTTDSKYQIYIYNLTTDWTYVKDVDEGEYFLVIQDIADYKEVYTGDILEVLTPYIADAEAYIGKTIRRMGHAGLNVSQMTAKIEQNTTDIAKNAEDIASNTEAIAANGKSIENLTNTLFNNISQTNINKGDIAEMKQDIAELQENGGATGEAGQNGATFTPSVSLEGVISWTNDKGLENPGPVNIKGDKGDKGDKGETGAQGEKGADGAKGETGAQGPQGDTGVAGADGQTPYIKDGYWWIGDTNTNVKAEGTDGQDGADGLCVFSAAEVSEGVSSETIYISNIIVPDGYSVKAGDLVIANGYLYRINSISIDSKTVEILYTGINLKGMDGEKGQRGTGILKVTTAPSSYTTAIGSYTPKYRIALSTVKSQSGVSEVLIGDIIQSSYYQYHIDYLDSSYAYISATRVSIRGATGAAGTAGTDGKDGEDYVLTDADKQEIADIVAVGDIPDYWQTHLDERVEDIRRAMESAGRNKSSFFFYSDAHWSNEDTYTAKLAPTLLKYLYKRTPINKTNYGGDIVSAESTDTDIMAYLWDWREQLRGLPNHHSVIGNHDDGNSTDHLLDTNYIYAYLLAPEENNDIVWGGDFYYYIDDKSESTRYLYLDVFYDGASSTQIEFAKEAIKSVPKDWHIVAICHAWFANDYSVYPPVLNGFATEMQDFLDMFDNYNAREDEYADCGGWVELCIGGHYHLDYYEHTAGGIPVIIVEADTIHNRSGSWPQKGTTDESTISAIVVDYNDKVVKVIRVGRGESYEVPINVTAPASYTNVIPLSIDKDGTPFNGGKGWMGDSRIGSGGIYAGGQGADVYVTGHIPITVGIDNVIRLKNVILDSSTNNNWKYMIGFFDESFARTTYNGTNDSLSSTDFADYPGVFSPVIDGTNVVQFTMSKNWMTNTAVKYFAICCSYLGDDSIITINEPID